jgi:hypothetical protein
MTADETGDCSSAAIGPAFSAGILAMEERLKSDGTTLPIVKCQTTGPISFALSITDENKRAIYYNEEFVDPVVKGLAMKCRWQIQKFRPYGENIVCFIDEPILAAFGSSTYVSVQRDDVIAKLGEVVEAIHLDGGIAGIHCCGNTDWSMLLDSEADIVSFDAFEFFDGFACYESHIADFLARGGRIAWGIVPTVSFTGAETAASLADLIVEKIDALSRKGIDADLLRKQSLITPACGVGPITDEKRAEEVLILASEVSREIRARR